MRRNVMVIDDDPDICDLLTSYFEGAEFVVRSIQDGLTALEELRANEYDLLVLDISLPQMNGFRVLKAIRGNEDFRDIPVIILTASGDKANVIRVQGEVSDYIIKPPQRADFLNRIERILHDRPQFAEIIFDQTDPLARGQFEVPVRLRSITKRGAVLTCPVPVGKNYILQTLQLGLLEKIGIVHHKFKVAACAKDGKGGFTYFVSFLGVNIGDQRKIRNWILERSVHRRSRVA